MGSLLKERNRWQKWQKGPSQIEVVALDEECRDKVMSNGGD